MARKTMKHNSRKYKQKWLKCESRHEEVLKMCVPNGWLHLIYALPYILSYCIFFYLLLVTQNNVINVFYSLGLGIGIYCLFVLHHDCMHGSAIKNKKINTLVGRLYALVFIMAFTTSKETHKRHHAYISDPERDPDEYYFSGTLKQIWLRIWRYIEWYTVISLTRYGSTVKYTVLVEYFVNISLWTGIHFYLYQAGMLDKAIFLFWLPMAFVVLIVNPITRGYEHAPLTIYEKSDPAKLDMSKNTVTVDNKFLALLSANIVYHTEHHAYPRMPFYNLPKLRKIFKEEKMEYLVAPYPLYKIFKGNAFVTYLSSNNK
jgi:fatty acid desaturase